jgi:hypothetical protein
VVAEGVERPAELEALTKLGCHRAQGFLFSRPVPADTIDTLLGSPGNWLFGVPTSRLARAGGKVRRNTRDHQLQLLDLNLEISWRGCVSGCWTAERCP